VKTPVKVQTNLTDSVAANPTVAYASAQTAGNMNILLSQWLGVAGDKPTAVTDTNGNVYRQAHGSPQFNAGPGIGLAVWYAIGINKAAAGANTIHVTSTTGDMEIVALEISGAAGWLDINALNFVNQPSGKSTDTATVTIHANNELVMAYEADASAGASPGGGAGWTADSLFPPNFGSMLEYQNAPNNTGSVTATVPMDSSTAGGMMVVFGVAPAGIPSARLLPLGI